MRLLLDQGLPHSSAELLRQRGIDSIHVAEINLSTADDREILQKARDYNRVVVTLDADFHAILALTEAILPSVIRIRIERLRAQALTNLLLTIVEQCEAELEQGSVITVEPNRIRVRRLPLLNS